jgi:hypothetical protein
MAVRAPVLERKAEPEAAPHRIAKKSRSDHRVKCKPSDPPTTGHGRRGRPSKRAQALVREQLADGPKRGEEVRAAAEAAEISERTLIAAAGALGVRARKGQWWLPGGV